MRNKGDQFIPTVDVIAGDQQGDDMDFSQHDVAATCLSDPDQSTESIAIQPKDSFSSCSRNVVSSTDIHFCLQASLSDEQKYSILKKLWIPGENFAFAASTLRNLRF